MLADDARGPGVRSTRAYRVAVWCVRLEFLILPGWFVVLAWYATGPTVPLFGLGFLVPLVGAASGIAGLVLLRRSGLLSQRTQAENPKVNREFFRDVLWGRR